MKDHCHDHKGHCKRFLIHLALEAITLAAAVATIHEVDRVRRAVKRIERR